MEWNKVELLVVALPFQPILESYCAVVGTKPDLLLCYVLWQRCYINYIRGVVHERGLLSSGTLAPE